MKKTTAHLVRLALFTTIALTIFILEGYLPPLLPLPGVKPGLSNIITLLVLFLMRVPDACIVLLLRIVLGSLFSGQMISFCYSLAGGFAALLVMALLKKMLQGHGVVLVSIFGAFMHNLGQLLVAVIVTGTWGVLAYLPVLMLSGAMTGAFTGLCARLLLPRLDRLFRFQ